MAEENNEKPVEPKCGSSNLIESRGQKQSFSFLPRWCWCADVFPKLSFLPFSACVLFGNDIDYIIKIFFLFPPTHSRFYYCFAFFAERWWGFGFRVDPILLLASMAALFSVNSTTFSISRLFPPSRQSNQTSLNHPFPFNKPEKNYFQLPIIICIFSTSNLSHWWFIECAQPSGLAAQLFRDTPALRCGPSPIGIAWEFCVGKSLEPNTSNRVGWGRRGGGERKNRKKHLSLGFSFQERSTLYAINKTFSTQQKRDTIPAGCWYEAEKSFPSLPFRCMLSARVTALTYILLL